MTTAVPSNPTLPTSHRKVILASSLGTMFEWYDFYLYGALATIIAKQFFSALEASSAFIFALLAFAAGFAVRPFGALVFGRIGDRIGRKYTFLITIVIMGVSTCLVGLLPSYETVGVLAPVMLIALRLLQGLALGGEYGGAATYVAEHAPAGKRGLYTSFIQTTATLGLLLSLLVILGCRYALGDEAFERWGWRLPFLLSVLLLGVSVWIRLQLQESPVFAEMRDQGKTSRAPLTESFLTANSRIVLLALFGATAGQAVVWYAGQFYALFFLTQTVKLDATTANLLIAGALVLGTPFFVLCGWLSDKIGRKPIVMLGCLLAALTYFPIFKGLMHFGNPAMEQAVANSPVIVRADPSACHVQFDPVGKAVFASSCDIAKAALARAGISYANEVSTQGSTAEVRIGSLSVPAFEGAGLEDEVFKARSERFAQSLREALSASAYPERADPKEIDHGMLLLLLLILVIYVTLVYGPIAAWLVELFPTRIRYTSMSLPYHLGNGWFGGFLPTISFAMVVASGNIYHGLWYPVAVAAMTLVIGSLFLPETRHVDLRGSN